MVFHYSFSDLDFKALDIEYSWGFVEIWLQFLTPSLQFWNPASECFNLISNHD